LESGSQTYLTRAGGDYAIFGASIDAYEAKWGAFIVDYKNGDACVSVADREGARAESQQECRTFMVQFPAPFSYFGAFGARIMASRRDFSPRDGALLRCACC
jgi:hypothetical protein